MKCIAVLTVAIIVIVLAPVVAAQDTTLNQRIEDGAITAVVKYKLVTARPEFAIIDVDTTNGVVRLQGTVPSERDRAEAERLARGSNGVQQVVNDLRIEPRGDKRRS
jgi:hyperosmotically inducible periplasmic protein